MQITKRSGNVTAGTYLLLGLDHVPVLESKAIAPKQYKKSTTQSIEKWRGVFLCRCAYPLGICGRSVFRCVVPSVCARVRCVRSDAAGRRDEGAVGAGRGAVRAAGRADGAPPPLRQGARQKQAQTRHLHHPQQQPHLRRQQQQIHAGILSAFLLLFG
jgi:hypothetical protein